MEASDQDISAGKSRPIEESDESGAKDKPEASDQDISAGKSGPTVEPESDESESASGE